MMNLHPDHDPVPSTPSSRAWLLYAVCVVLCAVAFVAGLTLANFLADRGEDGYTVLEEEIAGEVVDDDVDEVAPGFSLGSDEDETDEVATTPAGSPLTIAWIDPTLQPTTAFDSALYQALCYSVSVSVSVEEFDLSQNWCGSPPDVLAYRLGMVVGGEYNGRYLEMATASQPGMGIYYESYYLLRDPLGDAPLVLLDRHTRSTGNFAPSTMTYLATEMLGWNERLKLLTGYQIDTQSVVPELASFDSELTDTQGNRYLFTGYWMRIDSSDASALSQANRFASLSDTRRLALYDPLRDSSGVLLGGATAMGDNQFYLVDEDGRVLWYDLAVPFFEYQEFDNNLSVTGGLPKIRWNDGSMNTDAYYIKGAMGGCGFSQVTRTLTSETFTQLPPMVRMGVGVADDGSGTVIFEPSTYDHEYYDTAFNAINTTMFVEEGEEAPPEKSYADFAHPYLYFQDAFNRWIELSSQEIIPPVECGKPVIYLYPESTMDMSVWVRPRGGFSFTQPEYGDGWEVSAYPDGRLVNRADGLEYPYLFWEGRGGMYAPPSTYWVVAQSEVDGFLRETLAAMNLNDREIADFLEFWLPRMQVSPFYKIGFHDTRIMNELAPLALSVKPDNIFRVLMDYEGIEAWQPSKPPVRLPRANRDGFEVMEWGGVLR